jgi:hypothetical protein
VYSESAVISSAQGSLDVNSHFWRRTVTAAGAGTLCMLGYGLILPATGTVKAGPLGLLGHHHGCETGACVGDYPPDEWAGDWYWLRSPDEEKQATTALFSRYCLRCHGVDGRGNWDIPDVPNFTNPRWQASRVDGQLVRIILEGRGAIMPPFRGTLSLDEAWAMARYLRTLQVGTETPRPDAGAPARPAMPPIAPATGAPPESLPK